MDEALTRTRVRSLPLDASSDTWANDALNALARIEADPDVRLVLIKIPPGLIQDDEGSARLSRRLRGSGKLIASVLDGAYSGQAVTLMAGADLVLTSDQTRFATASTDSGPDPAWVAALPIREAKWLAFGAGELTAESLRDRGAINFVFPAGELEERSSEVAAHASRIAGDVITLKKRAHDTRHRIPSI